MKSKWKDKGLSQIQLKYHTNFTKMYNHMDILLGALKSTSEGLTIFKIHNEDFEEVLHK